MSYFTIGYGMIPAASSAEVREAVETAMTQAENEGRINDVREYNSFNKFPGNDPTKPEDRPIKGVEYVDLETDYEYIWEGNYDEHDKPIYVRVKDNAPLEDDAINNMFSNPKSEPEPEP